MKPELVEKLKIFKQKYDPQGFYIVGVFGSQARGDNRSGSDIDLALKSTLKSYAKETILNEVFCV